jgi:hypothetical protein
MKIRVFITVHVKIDFFSKIEKSFFQRVKNEAKDDNDKLENVKKETVNKFGDFYDVNFGLIS